MKYDLPASLTGGKGSIAVDLVPGLGPQGPKECFDVIPMWVADMNFPTVPTIQEAIIERAKHPMFGYFQPSREYYDSIIRWHEIRNGVTGLAKEHIGYENGVLGCVMSVVNAFSAPGDSVLLHSPTYIGFTGVLQNNGRRIILSDLVQDEEGVWRMDYADMDKKLKEHKIHLAIFCSPHNPCGRVWEREEIEKAMDVYKNNDCLVISDEIWSDIICYNNKHIPSQSVNEDAKNGPLLFMHPARPLIWQAWLGLIILFTISI